MKRGFLEGMREGQRTFLQEQSISFRHFVVFQHKDRNPGILERFSCPGPGTASFGIRCNHNGVISQARYLTGCVPLPHRPRIQHWDCGM